jgi:hypothetical protein
MRRAIVGLLCVLLVVLSAGSTGNAAPPPTIWKVGENAACDFDTIEDAIAHAYSGDTIKVQHDTYYEGPLLVNKSLHFIGGYGQAAFGEEACLTLTGTGRATVQPAPGATGPLFHVQGARVRVEWFVFEGGAERGVLVDNGGILSLENSVVQSNSDGGLSVVGATASLLETEILANNSDFGGGIFIDAGEVTASASLIQDNHCWSQGAGVYLRGGSAFNAVDGTQIDLNVTPMDCEDGGGVAALGTGTTVTIDGSQVFGNTALARGGGLYLAGGAQAWIQNGSLVQENQTYGPGVGGGGGAHVTGDNSSLIVDNSIFYLNHTDPNGAGIYADGGTVHVNGSWFFTNEARESGGGIYSNGASVTCRSSQFWYNRVMDYDGGAIYSIGIAGALDVEECGFYYNTTDLGNGGAIYAKHPWTSVRRSYFAQNTAPGDGSALFVSGMDIPGLPAAEVINSYIVDNPTPALAADAGEATPPSGEQPEGGGTSGSSLYAEYTTAHVTHNTFAHQSLAFHYGVLANAWATVHMVNNILTNFSVAVHRDTLVGSTGAAYASHTLFYGNSVNCDPTVVCSDDVLGAPAFVGGGNYELTPASAAINTGTDAGVALDYYGGHRPWGGRFEIGAEEYPRQERLFLPMVSR